MEFKLEDFDDQQEPVFNFGDKISLFFMLSQS
jgi:hypothetical protein